MIGLAVFAIASAFCGLATNSFVLNLARAAQRIGGAFLLTASLAILSNDFTGAERSQAFAFWGARLGIAIIGPAHPSPTFSFRKDGRVTSMPVDSQLAITINEGATASAVAGLGIAASSESSARAELEAGKLVRVLPDWDFASMEMNALFVSGKTIKLPHEHLPTSFSGSSVLLRTAPARASP